MKRHPLEEIHQWLLETGLTIFNDIIDEIICIRSQSGVLVKLRIIMIDDSYLDIYWSDKGKYSLHYERRHIDGKIYRHDNAPHRKHKHIRTFPKHFHLGDEDNVVESDLPDDPLKAVEKFLSYIRNIIKP